MKQREFIFSEKEYWESVRAFYKIILEGRFMSLSPNEMDETELLESIPTGITDEERGIGFVNKFCSWFTLGESRTNDYLGKTYKSANLCYGKDKSVFISYNRFIYALNVGKKAINYIEDVGINKVDEKTIYPSDFFETNKVAKILYIRSQKGIDPFKRNDFCSYFAMENILPCDIRRYILMAQYDFLYCVINNPFYWFPPAPESSIQIPPDPKWYSTNRGITIEVANKIRQLFKDEFQDSYFSKFSFIQKELSKQRL